jgi:hypothetical protein
LAESLSSAAPGGYNYLPLKRNDGNDATGGAPVLAEKK